MRKLAYAFYKRACSRSQRGEIGRNHPAPSVFTFHPRSGWRDLEVFHRRIYTPNGALPSPATRVSTFSKSVPGVPLRSTPGFKPSSATRTNTLSTFSGCQTSVHRRPHPPNLESMPTRDMTHADTPHSAPPRGASSPNKGGSKLPHSKEGALRSSRGNLWSA